ncbi:ABC transporter ATP-binding protein [Moorella sp. Hama-1]|uniref:ABC transporter ATP-binding protein n=1 Tax=Moorella sp. Hama-1 TaxID=2138101 RepID=UPI000D650B29|nr:ABC transporter ATP-binding protein [Moorella sp. Hama-1]BCV21700.1 ABC transporter ATP-binding protein [Moorella sp. Hama-1]
MRLVVKDVSFSYGSFPVLHGLTMEAGEGEAVSIVGPNGSGKSTLLRCAARILKPRQGVIYLDGKEIAALNGSELAKRLGYVPQAGAEVFPFTVLETVLMGRKPHLKWGVSKRDLAVVGDILRYMGLEPLAGRCLDQLSGGQKQKVLLARALAQEPDILLLDEPTSSLDIRHQLEVLGLIKNLAHQYRRTILMVMHDLNLAARFSEKLILLKDGCIFAAGKPQRVLTAENVAAVYGVEAVVNNGKYGLQVFPLRPVAGGEAALAAVTL